MKSLVNIIESIIFVNGEPLDVKDIAEKMDMTENTIRNAVKELKQKYSDPNSGIKLLVYNDKVQFCSNEKYKDYVSSVLNPIRERELSKSLLETIAIIAYKQPITKLELQEIRGVNSDYAVQKLQELSLIEIAGRKDAIGKPLLYKTTDDFLKKFELSSLDDLPNYDELLERIKVVKEEDENSYLYYRGEIAPSEDIEINADDLNFDVEDIPSHLENEDFDSID